MPEHRKEARYILLPVLPIKGSQNKTLQDIKPLKTSIHFSYISVIFINSVHTTKLTYALSRF